MTVLLLEDSDDRVDWLRRRMPEHLALRHVRTVSEFEAALAELRGHLQLIVLDHDLGYPPPTPYVVDSDAYDIEGRTGADAALMVPADIECPVLVWSMNGPAAQRMFDTLTANGVVAALTPFGAPTLATALHYLLQP